MPAIVPVNPPSANCVLESVIPRILLWLAPFALFAQPYDFSEVDRILTEAQTTLRTGIAVHLVQNNQVIYSKAFGNYTTSTNVLIASATKWPAGSLVMKMVDEGKLSLDDTTGKFFPNLTGDHARITVRQLFAHTSGVGGLDGGEADCISSRILTLAQCADLILAQPLAAPPGTQFAYGGNSMHVAGRIVEIVGGKSWNELFREKITGPLEMPQTIFALTTPANPRIAGGISSNALEYSNFVQMILNRGVFKGRQVLSARAVETMLQDQTFGVPIVYSPWTQYLPLLPPGTPNVRYGIGNWIEAKDGSYSINNSSHGAFGFGPWVDQERNLTGVFSVQNQLPNVVPFYFRMTDALSRAIPVSPLRARGITHAASFQIGPITPGQLVTLFASNLGPATAAGATLDAQGRVATIAAGTRVWFDGTAAPILFASASQITAVAPFALAGSTQTEIAIEFNGRRTAPILFPVAPAFPAFFTASGSRAAALNQDGSANSPSRPELRGRILQLFATGGGLTLPAPQDGRLASGPAPLVLPVSARIGGIPASVEYAGAAPSLVEGMTQINLRVPLAAPAGDNIAVDLIIGGTPAPAVTVAIR
jgi:uncharacterized protein (TIGR03437 family)